MSVNYFPAIKVKTPALPDGEVCGLCITSKEESALDENFIGHAFTAVNRYADYLRLAVGDNFITRNFSKSKKYGHFFHETCLLDWQEHAGSKRDVCQLCLKTISYSTVMPLGVAVADALDQHRSSIKTVVAGVAAVSVAMRVTIAIGGHEFGALAGGILGFAIPLGPVTEVGYLEKSAIMFIASVKAARVAKIASVVGSTGMLSPKWMKLAATGVGAFLSLTVTEGVIPDLPQGLSMLSVFLAPGLIDGYALEPVIGITSVAAAVGVINVVHNPTGKRKDSIKAAIVAIATAATVTQTILLSLPENEGENIVEEGTELGALSCLTPGVGMIVAVIVDNLMGRILDRTLSSLAGYFRG